MDELDSIGVWATILLIAATGMTFGVLHRVQDIWRDAGHSCGTICDRSAWNPVSHAVVCAQAATSLGEAAEMQIRVDYALVAPARGLSPLSSNASRAQLLM